MSSINNRDMIGRRRSGKEVVMHSLETTDSLDQPIGPQFARSFYRCCPFLIFGDALYLLSSEKKYTVIKVNSSFFFHFTHLI